MTQLAINSTTIKQLLEENKKLLEENQRLRDQLFEQKTLYFIADDTPGYHSFKDLYYEMDSFVGVTNFEMMLLFDKEMKNLVRNKDVGGILEVLEIYNKFKTKNSSHIELVY